MNRNLIGLYSPAMGCGKTALTDVLISQHGFALVKFAGTLKEMIRVLLADCGYKNGTEFTDGAYKETIIPELGVSTRHLMQTLGTDWGRQCVKQTIWVDVAVSRMRRLLMDGWKVVVDDVRFLNEFDAVRSLGGALVKVSRPGVTPTNGHASEGRLEDQKFDLELVNDRGLGDWQDLARDLPARL